MVGQGLEGDVGVESGFKIDIELDDGGVGALGFNGSLVESLFDPVRDGFAVLRFACDGEASAVVCVLTHGCGIADEARC